MSDCHLDESEPSQEARKKIFMSDGPPGCIRIGDLVFKDIESESIVYIKDEKVLEGYRIATGRDIIVEAVKGIFVLQLRVAELEDRVGRRSLLGYLKEAWKNLKAGN